MEGMYSFCTYFEYIVSGIVVIIVSIYLLSQRRKN